MPQLPGFPPGFPSVFGEKTESLLIAAIGSDGNLMVDTASGTVMKARLQYFPESISDSRSANYEAKDIPGSSHPIYQWVSSGERTLSFTAVFTQEQRLLRETAVTNATTGQTQRIINNVGPFGTVISPSKWSMDITGAVAFLRQCQSMPSERGFSSRPSVLIYRSHRSFEMWHHHDHSFRCKTRDVIHSTVRIYRIHAVCRCTVGVHIF